jgi:hypothetical protein
MIWLHLKMCKHCARFADQLYLMQRIVERMEWRDDLSDPEKTLPAEVRQRIKSALQSA